MPQTLRILHILRAPVGGLFRHVRDLALEQVKWGLEVGVLCDAKASDGLTAQRLAQLEPHLPLGLHSMPMSRAPGIGDLKCIRETHRLAREFGIDILHGHGAKGGFIHASVAAFRPVRRDCDRCGSIRRMAAACIISTGLLPATSMFPPKPGSRA